MGRATLSSSVSLWTLHIVLCFIVESVKTEFLLIAHHCFLALSSFPFIYETTFIGWRRRPGRWTKGLSAQAWGLQSYPQNPCFTPKADVVTCILTPTILWQDGKWRHTLQISRFLRAQWSFRPGKPGFSIHIPNYHPMFVLCWVAEWTDDSCLVVV